MKNKYRKALNSIRNFVITSNTNQYDKSIALHNSSILQELVDKEIYKQICQPKKWRLISENDFPSAPLRVLIQMNNGWNHVSFYEDGKWFLPREDEPLEENDYYKVIAWTELPKYDWSDEDFE